jgi:hypothetical protein
LPTGFLVIDTFSPIAHPLNAEFSNNRSYIIRSDEWPLYGYIPSAREIKKYAASANFEIKEIPYITSTNRPRVLYVLFNQNKKMSRLKNNKLN